jgi:hypothetical protein
VLGDVVARGMALHDLCLPLARGHDQADPKPGVFNLFNPVTYTQQRTMSHDLRASCLSLKTTSSDGRGKRRVLESDIHPSFSCKSHSKFLLPAQNHIFS